MNEIVDQWAIQQAGAGCFLCPPQLEAKRDIRKIISLSISSLYLINNQRFAGQSTLIFDSRHSTRLDDLSDDEYAAFTQDLRISVRGISAALHPDHVNVALLGNSCPHLHWGIVPRYRTDLCWGRPIWEGTTVKEMRLNPTLLAEADFDGLLSRLRDELLRLAK